jgi:hypothetical protein
MAKFFMISLLALAIFLIGLVFSNPNSSTTLLFQTPSPSITTTHSQAGISTVSPTLKVIKKVTPSSTPLMTTTPLPTKITDNNYCHFPCTGINRPNDCQSFQTASSCRDHIIHSGNSSWQCVWSNGDDCPTFGGKP